MPITTKTVLLACLLAAATRAAATPLFSDDTIIDVEIAGPMERLIANKTEREEMPFVLRADGHDHEVRVRVRGKSRIRVCKFAPLRVNFKKKATAGTLFEGQDKLKLATHCRDSDEAEKDVL